MSENLNHMTVSLNETQVRVLHEILNLSGLELTQLDAEYGSDSIDTIVGREPLLVDVNVARVSNRLFTLLGSMLEQFEKERNDGK